MRSRRVVSRSCFLAGEADVRTRAIMILRTTLLPFARDALVFRGNPLGQHHNGGPWSPGELLQPTGCSPWNSHWQAMILIDRALRGKDEPTGDFRKKVRPSQAHGSFRAADRRNWRPFQRVRRDLFPWENLTRPPTCRRVKSSIHDGWCVCAAKIAP